jgi:hypothetical protein
VCVCVCLCVYVCVCVRCVCVSWAGRIPNRVPRPFWRVLSLALTDTPCHAVPLKTPAPLTLSPLSPQLTDPFLQMFRGIIPAIGGIDLSPMLGFFLLNFIRGVLM